MNAEKLDRLEVLFRAARSQPPEERAAFVEAACAEDAELKRELASLLEADLVEEGESVVDVPAGDVVAARLQTEGSKEMS